jgi:hypothetical protein
MSESSGSLVRSGNPPAGNVVVCFDALSRAGFSSVKHYFALFPKKPARKIIFRDPFRILTPVAFRVYDEEFLGQWIRDPAQWERRFGLFPLRSGESARPAERRERRNARRFTDGPTGPAEES